MSKKLDNPLEVSDEEFMNNPSKYEEQEQDETTAQSEDTNTKDTDTNRDKDSNSMDSDSGDTGIIDNSDTEKDVDSNDDANTDNDEGEEESSETENEETEEETSEESNDTELDDNKDSDDSESDQDTKDKDTPDLETLKAFYEKVMAPFKANGTMLKMKSADDIITLNQMGANYHQKMSALKPHLKVVKLLDKHGLLDIEKLNYLIDLHEKNPDAITKLVKDSKIDIDNIEETDISKYKPSQREVTDLEYELDSVLEEIKTTPTYSRTIQTITEDWDDASRQEIASKPNMIRAINDHMASGVFDKVATALAYEKSLGKLEGMSDFEAYQRIGASMYEAGLLGDKPQKKTVNHDNPEPNKMKAKRKQQKKAATTTKSKKAPVKKAAYNPLAMSDEEFAKLENIDI